MGEREPAKVGVGVDEGDSVKVVVEAGDAVDGGCSGGCCGGNLGVVLVECLVGVIDGLWDRLA